MPSRMAASCGDGLTPSLTAAWDLDPSYGLKPSRMAASESWGGLTRSRTAASDVSA